MTRRLSALLTLFGVAALALSAQVFTTLHSFDGSHGWGPLAALTQGADGNLYGTTCCGGANGSYGTLFKITPSGRLTTLYNFCAQSGCTDGSQPSGALLQARNGELYGTTRHGGADDGTIFKVTTSGALTTLYTFCSQSGCTDGNSPQAGLIQATDGSYYGTTAFGGAHSDGTIFKITPSGMLNTLYSFCGVRGCPDGTLPYAGLVQAPNGDFWGTTRGGGANVFYGAIFKITPAGSLTTIYSFCGQLGCPDGDYPLAGLVQATDGNFYGSTSGGGIYSRGTLFKITRSGVLATLYSFCSQSACADGSTPGALAEATDGNLYGTTTSGGAHGYGTIFEITPGGTFRTLYDFCSQTGCADGAFPEAGLVQATNGTLYGTTEYGGANETCRNGCGTVFSLSVGLSPFVKPQPASAQPGAIVQMLGTNLTGATAVNFNGTSAAFKVALSSLIVTAVPAGATSGNIQVVTPSGTLLSNVPFRVLP